VATYPCTIQDVQGTPLYDLTSRVTFALYFSMPATDISTEITLNQM
jgi:hypothetical protein